MSRKGPNGAIQHWSYPKLACGSIYYFNIRSSGQIQSSVFLIIRPSGQKFSLPVFLLFGLPDSV